MIFVLNNFEQVVTTLNNDVEKACPYSKDRLFERLSDGMTTYEFTIPETHPDARFVQENGYLVRKGFDEELLMFQIVRVEDGRGEDGAQKYIYAEYSWNELNGVVIRPNSWLGIDAKTALNNALADTRWQSGIVEWFEPRDFTYDEHVTALKFVQDIKDEYGAEIRFRVEMNNGEISGRFVDLLVRRGNEQRDTLINDFDIKGIKRIHDRTTVVTALIGLGKGDKEGENLKFTDITWSVEAGDPTDKPYGQDWVGDDEALQRWGIDGKHITETFIYDTTSKETLLQKTWEEVQRRKNGLLNYEVDVLLRERVPGFDFKKLRLGDTQLIQDLTFKPALMVDARVIELERSFTDPEADKAIFGDFLETLSNAPDSWKEISERLIREETRWIEGGTEVVRSNVAPTETDVVWIDSSKSDAPYDIVKNWDEATQTWVKAAPTEANEVGAATPQDVSAVKEYAEKMNTNGLAMIMNANTFSTAGTNPGELYFHGFDENGNPADVDGYIIIDGIKQTIIKGMLNPNNQVDQGYIMYDTTDSLFYLVMINSEEQWIRYNATPGAQHMTIFTPGPQHYFIGYVEMDGPENFTHSILWQQPRDYAEISRVGIIPNIEQTAETAKTTAETAETTANTANQTANTAKQTADDAWGKFSGVGNTLPSGNVEFNFAGSTTKGGNALNTDKVGTQDSTTVQNVTLNFNARNDRISTVPANPTIASDGSAIDHTINKDGSADISFEWMFGSAGNAYDIDGFIIYIRSQSASTAYTFGTMSGDEQVYYVTPEKRAFILYGAAADKYYTFGVQAYRLVDNDVAAGGVLKSAIVKSAVAGENPYRPSSTVAFAGTITGTINGKTPAEVTAQEENAKTAVQNGQVTLPTGALSGDVNADQNAIVSSESKITFSRYGIEVSDPTGTKQISSMTKEGFNVKDGSFTMEDDVSNVKYSIVPKTNLIYDHSFEMVRTDGTAADPTYGDFAVDESDPDNFYRWQWPSYGSARLDSSLYGDPSEVAIFGNQSIVINSLSFPEQMIETLKPNKTYTLSCHFRTHRRSPSGGVPRFIVEAYDSADQAIAASRVEKNFPQTPTTGEVVRYSLPFTTYNGDFAYYRIVIYTADSNWVQADGVQLVEGNMPCLYDAENSLWSFRRGADHSRLIDQVGSESIYLNGQFELMAWQTPALLNGWTNYGGAYGPVRYRQNPMGQVEIIGTVKNTAWNTSNIFVLPPGMRPAYEKIYNVGSWNTFGTIHVSDSGGVRATVGDYRLINFDITVII
jgi:phage minor structural protein